MDDDGHGVSFDDSNELHMAGDGHLPTYLHTGIASACKLLTNLLFMPRRGMQLDAWGRPPHISITEEAFFLFWDGLLVELKANELDHPCLLPAPRFR